MAVYFSIFLLLFASCQPSSSQDFQKEGEALRRQIIQDLHTIQNPDELARIESVLKKRFINLMELIIEAHCYLSKHPEERSKIDYLEHDAVFIEELVRVQNLEGGKEMLERVQKEALLRWDRFSGKEIQKKNASHSKN